jgi:glycine/D-amino acid oxidase-like deaminating enzyme
MLGVSFALGTAELVAALLDGRDPPADMTPFEPDRFRRTR